jgi:hypothetical protein
MARPERVIKKSPFFLKKRSKRLLFRRPRQDPGHGRDLGSGGETKVFLLLFLQKKKSLTFGRRSPA